MEVYKTDIRDKKEFDRCGYHYTMVEQDEENRIYVFRVTIKNGLPQPYESFEIVKAKLVKNPDGTTVQQYPGSEDFGKYGFYICGNITACKNRLKVRRAELMALK